MNTQDQYQEINKYDAIIRPYMEQFITNNVLNSVKLSFSYVLLNIYFFINDIFSETVFQRWKEKRILLSIHKKNKQKEKLKIKEIVRSYKNSFLKFNLESTCFEKASDCFQKNYNTDVYSREQHKTITNRHVERFWKND